MEVLFLGGASEQGRSCIVVSTKDAKVMVDCGVKREFGEGFTGRYPQFDLVDLNSLDAVLVSHAHEDHCAALPLLRRMGVKAPVYAHPVTVEEAKKYCLLWLGTVQSRGVEPPYSEEDIVGMRITPLGLTGELRVGGLIVRYGDNGHMPGSLWFSFREESYDGSGVQVLYTGDWTTESRLLKSPEFPAKVQCVVTDAAYGAALISQDAFLDGIHHLAITVRQRGGFLLLPLPRLGRSQEIMLYLASRLPREVPLYVESSIVAGLGFYRDHLEIVSAEGLKDLQDFDKGRIEILNDSFSPQKVAPGVILAADGMASNGKSRQIAQILAERGDSCIVFSGHVARGTFGDLLLTRGIPSQALVKAEKWKVHPDIGEIRATLQQIAGPGSQVALVHADHQEAVAAAKILAEDGYKAIVPKIGDRITVSTAV